MSIERERLDAAGAARVRRANTRRFAALLLAQACLLLGSAILCFACPLYVLDETGSATAYGLVGAVSFLPYLAATPLGGVLADRADCGRIFTVLGMGLAAVTACMPLCRNALGSVASTIVLLCAVYAAQAICKPAVQAAIPELLGDDQVERGCAWASQVTMGANILGPFAGAALYGWAGIDGAGAVASLGFAVSVIVGTLVSRAPSCNKERDAKKGQGPDLGLRNAIAFFGANQTLLLTVLLAALFNLALAGASLGAPVVVSVHLGAPVQWVGLIEGAAGAGGLVGGLMVGVSPHGFNAGHMGRYILLSTLGVVPVWMSLAAGAPVWAACTAYSLGIFWVMLWANIASIELIGRVQREAARGVRGKALSVVYLLLSCATPIGQMVYGYAYDMATPAVVMAAMVAAGVLVALLLGMFERKGSGE